MMTHGKLALITGASRGIGEGTAKAIAQKAGRVVLVARTASSLEKVAQEIIEAETKAEFFAIDLSQPEAVSNLLLINASSSPILNSPSLFCFLISGRMLSRYRRDLVNRLPLPVISPNGKMKHQKAACRTDLPG